MAAKITNFFKRVDEPLPIRWTPSLSDDTIPVNLWYWVQHHQESSGGTGDGLYIV